MRRAGVAILLLAVLSTGGWTQEAPKKPAARPIAGLEWLVGGVWTADATKLGPGLRRIETRYQWSDNNAYIRFNTHFVKDSGAVRTYDGNFYWDPDQSSLSMWYMDAENGITAGPVKVDDATMLITFRARSADGPPIDFRVTVTRKSKDDYNWLLEQKQAAGWKRLKMLEYLRTAGS